MRFGRVADDGTVYVRTADGEREVGSYPGASPEEALAYFARKYDELAAQVELFEQRLTAADVPVGEIDSSLAKLRTAMSDVRAVGDLDALAGRVEALGPVAAAKRKEAEAAREQAREQARARRTALVEEAEKIAAVPAERTQWRTDGQRMRELFETWQAEQRAAGGKRGGTPAPTAGETPAVRLDRRSEEELWKRFSHARTAFDRKRRQHFAHLDEQHGEAKAAKEKLVKEAEALQGSTDWGPTAAAYKRLMDRWRTAGRAARKDDDELWQRFRAAQDAFFAARHAVQAEQDAEFSANLQVKEQLLVEAEALVPVTDLDAAKSALRDIQDRWEAAGKVPRGDLERVERRLRAVEQAVRQVEDARWRNTNPEARARAQSAVDQLENAIADLEADLKKAHDQGKAKRVAEAEAAIAARREWLEQARKALQDFGG
ncbi:ATPase [Angustibacter sp. Root456]|nr:ATPase [Angustibacter sp. Root456]